MKNVTEPIQSKLAKRVQIIRDLFVLWTQTMYPGMDEYFAVNSYIPEGDNGAWLSVKDTRPPQSRTFSITIVEMLSDIDQCIALDVARQAAHRGLRSGTSTSSTKRLRRLEEECEHDLDI